MWLRFSIALALIIAILATGLLTMVHIDSVCNQIHADLERSAQNTLSGGDDGAGLQEAQTLWESKLPIICTYVIHDQVDVATEAFQRALGFLQSENWDEYLATLRELQFRVGLIRDYDRPTIRSIF